MVHRTCHLSCIVPKKVSAAPSKNRIVSFLFVVLLRKELLTYIPTGLPGSCIALLGFQY